MLDSIKMIKFLKLLRYKFVLFLIILKRVFRNKTTKNSNSTDDSVFFILGSGRNGSTLLARLLNNHLKIFLPPEQFALPYTIIDWHSSFFKTSNLFYKKQLGRYFSNNQNWKLDKNDFGTIERELKTFDAKNRSPRNIFKLVFKNYSSHSGNQKKILGDHSPLTTVFYQYIYQEFPMDKYIFLLRHPFDVVLSYSKMPDNPASYPLTACWKWNNSIKAYDYLTKKRCNVLLVKYEDLVMNPNEVLNQLQTFLRVTPQDLTNEKLDNIEESLGTKSLNHHKNLNNPINSKSINKWEDELDPKVISTIHKLVYKNASRFDYNLDKESNNS